MGDYDNDTDNGDQGLPPGPYVPPRSYALSGRIMLAAIIVLFFVVVIMVSLHLYARWYLLRRRQRRHFLRRNGHNRRTHIVLYADFPVASASRGLDSSVLKSLPIFTFSSAAAAPGEAAAECAVCLSEFEDGEAARLLPKCKHTFHVDCIDMWFHSHSTCPLCRSPVERVGEDFVAIAVPGFDRAEAGTSSGLCSSCQHEEAPGTAAAASSSSSGAPPLSGRRKPPELAGFSIEVPRWADPEDEPRCDTPASRLRSPVSRMLSFKRILSREMWGGSLSPSAAAAASSPASRGPPAAEADVERGLSPVGRGETQHISVAEGESRRC
ncbi:hypothetical protein BT93_H2604 [Corymbia citriodora subsp. variegata]|nr:hypothetical protein BT93_H2604 [Corymbia citriodora subsp. variegata]